MFKVCYEIPLPPSVASRLPALQCFDSVVMQALARDPDERFANAGQFLAALLQAQTTTGRTLNTDETIIEARPSLAAAPVGTINGGAGSLPPASTNTLVGAGWNLELLGDIERRLARYVGPIAKVMVRRAAKEARDVEELTQALADKISKTAHRDEFLKGVGVLTHPDNPLARGPVETAAPSDPAAAGTGAGTTQGTRSNQRLLTPEDVTRASQLLTAHMGPIAPLLAKRAAKPSATREQFIAALAPYFKDDRARSRFLDAFR
jgi:serine/threonine-protein kinase